MDEEKTIPPKLFVSYSHRDRGWLDEFMTHIKPRLRLSEFELWSDKQIKTGSKWREEIETAINKCDIGVMLVTPNFLASDFIYKDELPPLIKDKKVFWIPVRTSAVDAVGLDEFQSASDPSRPLNSMNEPERDEAWLEICKNLSDIAKQATTINQTIETNQEEEFVEDFTGSRITAARWQISAIPGAVVPSPDGLRLVGVADRFPIIWSLGSVFPESGNWTCNLVFRYETVGPCGTSVRVLRAEGDILRIHQDNTNGRSIELFGRPIQKATADTNTISIKLAYYNGVFRLYSGADELIEHSASVRPTHIEFGNRVSCPHRYWNNLLIERVEVRRGS